MPSLATLARAALGCPDCQAGRTARAWVASDHFWSHLSIALAPFVVVVAVALVVRRIVAAADAGQQSTRG